MNILKKTSKIIPIFNSEVREKALQLNFFNVFSRLPRNHSTKGFPTNLIFFNQSIFNLKQSISTKMKKHRMSKTVRSRFIIPKIRFVNSHIFPPHKFETSPITINKNVTINITAITGSGNGKSCTICSHVSVRVWGI